MAVGTLGPLNDLGPAAVVWGDTTIAELFGDVRWTLTGESAPVFAASYGATPVDTIMLGYSACEMVIPATKTTLAILAAILPGGTNSSGVSGTVEFKVSGTGSEVGNSMYDNGLPMFVKPIINGVPATYASRKWLRLERTYPVPNLDVVFNLTDQRVYGLTFKAHPDATSKQLWSIGQVAIGTSY